MAGPNTRLQSLDARIDRLAASIDALAAKDEETLRRNREIAGLRKTAASELHRVCAEFVQSVNIRLAHSAVALDPPDLSDTFFRDDGPNLIQVNIQGRILQIEFEATPELVSTEDFRIPYTLSGSIRAFNQQMLEKQLIEEQLIFYTVEKHRSMWRFFDGRTYRSGPMDQEYLISIVELLV